MRRTIVLGLLFLIAIGAVYAFVAFVDYHPASQATKLALPEASRDNADPKGDRLPAKKPTAPLAPSFELVRVEPDGSAVVAGKAEPDVKVELVVGSRIVGESTAGSDGNFVIVLEEPLRPGDYRLALRSTGPGGAVVMSVDNAIVSVPATIDGGD